MSRALNLKLQPQEHAQHGMQLQVYTYGDSVEWGSMRETVYLDAGCDPIRFTARLTPAEARMLASHLLQVADQADESKARRGSLEEIEEQLRDPDFDNDLVTFVHPDVVYVEPGQLSAASLLHPGKVLTQRNLLREIWGPSYVESSHYLRVYVGHLRQKLEIDPTQPRHFLTETGVGYRFQP